MKTLLISDHVEICLGFEEQPIMIEGSPWLSEPVSNLPQSEDHFIYEAEECRAELKKKPAERSTDVSAFPAANGRDLILKPVS